MKRCFVVLALICVLALSGVAKAEGTGMYLAPKFLMSIQNNYPTLEAGSSGVSEDYSQFTLGGALALGWFSNVPLWGGIFLVLFLEWGLSAMWFGLHVALRRDTRSLNRKLSEYQKRGPES